MKATFNPECSCHLCSNHDFGNALSAVVLNSGSAECLYRYVSNLETTVRYLFQGDVELADDDELIEFLMEGHY